MDFWFHFEHQRKKLDNNACIRNILDEDGRIQHNEQFNVFREHLPLTPDDFWQIAVENISSYDNLNKEQINKEIIEYMLLLVNYYTEDVNSSATCSLLASQFYLKLLNIIGTFNSVIFENTLKCLKKYVKHSETVNYLVALRVFLTKGKLEVKYLEAVLFQMCLIVKGTTNVYSEFLLTKDSSCKDVILHAFLCIKCISIQKISNKAHTIVNYALFTGIVSNDNFSRDCAMRKTLRNLMNDLKPFLRSDNFANFQNVFLFIVAKSHKFDEMEACRILSTFDVDFCKSVMFKLIKMGTSKELVKKDNLLKLFAKLLENLPTNYYEGHKLKVFIQSTLNILILNCLENDEIMTIISKLFLLNKEIINKEFEILLNTPTEHIYVENSLPTFCSKFNTHWINRKRNKNIAIIILRIISNTFDVNMDEKYGNIFAMIGCEADPSDMKIAIPLILNLYSVAKKKHSKCLSEKILEFLYAMSVHSTSSSSSEFSKIVFDLILKPNEEMQQFRSEFISTFSTLIIDDNKVLIERANEMKLLNSEAIKKLINRIMEAEYEFVRITCGVVEKLPNPQGEKIIYHVMANPFLLSEGKYVGDLLFIIHSGIKFFATTQKNLNLTETQRDNLHNFTMLLWDSILKFTLSYNALNVSLNVLETLRELRRENSDPNVQILFEKINSEVGDILTKLPGSEDVHLVPLVYAAELVSNKQFQLEEVSEKLCEALERIIEARSCNVQNSRLEMQHYFCLVLIVRISMRYSSYAGNAMNFLRKSLQLVTNSDEFKISLMDLMYDLSSFVVHNFDEFLNYTFENLKSHNVICRRQAVKHIEHFVRMDYLKLNLEQYCLFVCIFGNPNIERNVQKILTNFMVSNQGIVEKYFIGLVLHLNFYATHPMCPMSEKHKRDMDSMLRQGFNKWKLYSTLFRTLSLRSKFLILKEVSASFFDAFTRGKLRIEDGFWCVISDFVRLFKTMAYTSLDNINYNEFFTSTLKDIGKYLINGQAAFPEGVSLKAQGMEETVERITHSLLHLMFHTENEAILRNYKLGLFEAIMFWTYDLLPDISAICTSRKDKTTKKIINYYRKLAEFHGNHREVIYAEFRGTISELNETTPRRFI